MGKALPKYCEICKKNVSGANWAKHQKKVHKDQEAKFKIVREDVTFTIGRPIARPKLNDPISKANILGHSRSHVAVGVAKLSPFFNPRLA